MTSPQQRKGDNAERELVGQLRALGLPDVERAYGAGRPDDMGDLDGLPFTIAQVKHYADGWRAIREAVDGAAEQRSHMPDPHLWLPVGFVRYPRKPRWIVAMDVRPWVRLFREATER